MADTKGILKQDEHFDIKIATLGAYKETLEGENGLNWSAASKSLQEGKVLRGEVNSHYPCIGGERRKCPYKGAKAGEEITIGKKKQELARSGLKKLEVIDETIKNADRTQKEGRNWLR